MMTSKLSIMSLLCFVCFICNIIILVFSDYRPQMKFAKVTFFHVSVCPQEGSTWAGNPWAGTPPPEQVHPPGQVHPLGRYTPRQVHLPREQCMLGDTGNKQAARILLECILILKYECKSKNNTSVKKLYIAIKVTLFDCSTREKDN